MDGMKNATIGQENDITAAMIAEDVREMGMMKIAHDTLTLTTLRRSDVVIPWKFILEQASRFGR